jgi:hypothetical protein
MPQASLSGNWFSAVSRAIIGDASNLRTSQLLGELMGAYNADPEPPVSEMECGSSCGICYPVPLETRPHFDGDGRSYSSSGTVGVSDKWFNGMTATSGEPLSAHKNSGGSYPLWWDDLWYGKNSSIEDVLSAIQDRIDVVTPRTQRS